MSAMYYSPNWLVWPNGKVAPNKRRPNRDDGRRERLTWLKSLPKATRLFRCKVNGLGVTVYRIYGQTEPYWCPEPTAAIERERAVTLPPGEIAATITGGCGPMSRRFMLVKLSERQREKFRTLQTTLLK
jgi:hypothetical protein